MLKNKMKLVFEKGLGALMYFFEIENLAKERLGNDLGALLMSFLKEDPEPWSWEISDPLPSPWDALTHVDASDGIDLPLFAP